MGRLSALGVSIVLLALNGFFVAVEFALLASRRARLNQMVSDGNRQAERASRSLGELTVMLAGAQLGITVCSFGLGALAEPAIADGLAEVLHRPVHVPEGLSHVIAFIIALMIVVFVHMVVGEMAPKSWAITHPERSALILITPFRAFTFVVHPLLVALNAIANGFLRLFGIQPKGEVSMALSSAELDVLLQRSREHGTLDLSTHALLTRSLSLSASLARHTLTPRSKIAFVADTADASMIEECARTSGRSRILVTHGDLDHILGMILVRDLLALTDEQRSVARAKDLVRPVARHREDEPIDEILLATRAGHRQLVVIVDASDRTAGILTVQDILDHLLVDPGSTTAGPHGGAPRSAGS
ncbi:MAG: hemolysin family protein [Ilumatobacteraceae bacterium]